MAKSVTYYSNKYNARQLRLELTQTPDIATNTSRIDWKFISAGSWTNETLYLVCATTIKINGEQVYYKGLTNWYGDGGSPENPKKTFPACEGSTGGSVTVKHNADGTLSIPIYFKTAVFTSAEHKDYGGTWTLDSIPRGASITAAPNFTDDENPTVTYTNAAGNAVTNLDISIYNPAGQVAYADYRAASKTGTSYTFNLTSAERTKLRQAATGNTLPVKFYLRTIIDGNYFYSSVEKTLTIANPNPTLNPTVVDSNETTKALTGDANKLVKYYSNAYYTINAAAVKNSSLTAQSVTHNGTKKTTATGTYNAVESGSFAFAATDSRGNTSTKTITKTMVNYVRLTCNHEVKINTSGVATIKASGNYFNASFGAVANTLTVQYRYKTQGGSWSSWTAMTVSKSGNTYTATITKSGLDYKTNYVFQCQAVDKLATSTTGEITTKALPVFDWGANDFQFNVPVVFAAGFTQSASVIDDEEPTGDYVIEQGVASVDGFVWQYRKWNGGSYECWGISNISTAVNTQWGGLYVSGSIAATNKKFPITFAAIPNVNATLSGSGSGGFLIASGSGTTSTTHTGIFEIARGTALAGAGTFNINFQVKGRWK